MGKFDPIWHELKPKAIRLRQEGLTPQQTCTELAWTEFKDKEKFNTVKGWYKRTFSDWPSEQDTTSLNERRPRQIGVPYQQQQAYNHPNRAPAPLPPQCQQNFPQIYGVQQGSISSSSQQPSSFPPQASYQNQHPRDATDASFQQGFHQYPAFGLLQDTSSASSHRQGGPQNHLNTIASQISAGQIDSPFRQHASRSQYRNISQLPAQAIEQPHHQNYTQYQRHSHSQHALQTAEDRPPVRRDSLPEPEGPFHREIYHKSPSFEKTLAGYQLPLDFGSFEISMDPDYLTCIDNNEGAVNSPIDDQQSTMQSTVVPDEFVLRSEGRGFNTQLPNHHSVSGSSAGSFVMNSIHLYQAYASPSHQYPNDAVPVRSERSHNSTKHYRSNSALPSPTPPPQYPLPQVPPPKFGVIHKGPKQPWQLIRMDGNGMAKVNPNEIPYRPSPKTAERDNWEKRDSRFHCALSRIAS